MQNSLICPRGSAAMNSRGWDLLIHLGCQGQVKGTESGRRRRHLASSLTDSSITRGCLLSLSRSRLSVCGESHLLPAPFKPYGSPFPRLGLLSPHRVLIIPCEELIQLGICTSGEIYNCVVRTARGPVTLHQNVLAPTKSKLLANVSNPLHPREDSMEDSHSFIQ